MSLSRAIGIALGLAATLLISSTPLELQARETLLQEGEGWRYYNEGSQAPNGWENQGFDDSAWAEGSAPIGYGYSDLGTTIEKGAPLTYRTVYYRNTFNVDDTSDFTGLILDVYSEKGAIVYLNGEEIYRVNMQPRQRTRYEAFAVTETEDWIRGWPVPLGRLVEGENVLAVETHQNEPRAERMRFDATLSAAENGEAQLFNGPWATVIRSTSAQVMWETDAPTETFLEYGPTPSLGLVKQGSGDKTFHKVILDGLTPFTTYYYRVSSTQGVLAEGSKFKTAPVNATPFRMVVYGDNRSSPSRHQLVSDAAAAFDPDLIINTGDLVEAGQYWDQWHRMFFSPARNLLKQSGIMVSVGNHEANTLHPGSYLEQYFPSPVTSTWYTYEYGDIQFIFLDTSKAHGPASRQVRWLESTLASSTASIIVAVHHYPVWSSGKHGSDPFAVSAFLPLYEEYGVSMVLNGHDHLYEHSEKEGIHYFLVGNGGAGIYDPDQSRNPHQTFAEGSHGFAVLDYDGAGVFTMTAYRTDGSVMEETVIDTQNVP